MGCVFTPDSVFKSVPPKGSESTWQTSMLYSYIVLLVCVNEIIYLYGNLPFFQDSCQSFYGPGWLTWCHSLSFETFPFFPFINRLLWLYNIQLKTSRGVTLSAPFWCLCQKLSLSSLYFNKTSLYKSSEWSSLVSGPRLNSSPPEAKNPGVFAWFSNNPSSLHIY